jgi:alpha-L-fucosidase
VVPAAEAERLQEMGAWLRVNGEAIYGTGPTLFGPEAGSFSATEKDKNGKPKFVPAWEWRSTTKADKIYIELFKWPAGTFHLDKVPRTVTGGYLLADPLHRRLKIATVGEGLDMTMPDWVPDPIATVLVLETK